MARIYIDGAGFAMEHCTNRTPDSCKHYIFLGDEIVYSFESREEALEQYREMCRTFYTAKLVGQTEREQLLGARGLLSLDRTALDAWKVLARQGSEIEKTKAAFWIRKLSVELDSSLI